jgi:hypothetical protein
MAKCPERGKQKSAFEYNKPIWGQQFFLILGQQKRNIENKR